MAVTIEPLTAVTSYGIGLKYGLNLFGRFCLHRTMSEGLKGDRCFVCTSLYFFFDWLLLLRHFVWLVISFLHLGLCYGAKGAIAYHQIPLIRLEKNLC